LFVGETSKSEVAGSAWEITALSDLAGAEDSFLDDVGFLFTTTDLGFLTTVRLSA
jgi:hypothetical protein